MSLLISLAQVCVHSSAVQVCLFKCGLSLSEVSLPSSSHLLPIISKESIIESCREHTRTVSKSKEIGFVDLVGMVVHIVPLGLV